MEKSVIQRIKFLFDSEGVSYRKFSQKIGMSDTGVKNVLVKGQNPSISMLEHILQAYPEIRREWLYEGEGEMKQSSEKSESLSWKEEAYRRLETENERLWHLVEALIGKGAASAMLKQMGNRQLNVGGYATLKVA